MKKIYLLLPRKIGTIAPEIYGHFSEHIGGVFYDGLWVGKDSDVPNIRGFRKDIVEKLREIQIPVLRWPGGCFAETYDWRDGIGEDRPLRWNWWKNDDRRTESNAVGTHEFMDLCEMIGAKGYFAANLTSVPPVHVRDWMDYCLSPKGTTSLAIEREKNGHPEPFNIPFWGVGNENWGGGGYMRPEFYADECRRYATIMHNLAPEVELYACGSNGGDYGWSNAVIPGLGQGVRTGIKGFAMHYYCAPVGDQLHITPEVWDQTVTKARMLEPVILRNWHILCAHDKQADIKLVVDEWGCWWHPQGTGPSKGYNLFEQQNTMLDALVAALTLNMFNRHCDKIRMANIAQLVNNLHALFLAGGSDCVATPTYYIYDMYKPHQGAVAIDTYVDDDNHRADSLSVSASVRDGKLLITLANLSCREDVEVSLEEVGFALPNKADARLLSSEELHGHNTYDAPDAVKPVSLQIDPTRPMTVPRGGVMAIEAAIG